MIIFKASKQKRKGNIMEIKTKGELIQKFVDLTGKEQKLRNDLAAMVHKIETLKEVIKRDEQLMQLITSGGITTHSDQVVLIGDNGLTVGKVGVSYSINDELSDQQLTEVNES